MRLLRLLRSWLCSGCRVGSCSLDALPDPVRLRLCAEHEADWLASPERAALGPAATEPEALDRAVRAFASRTEFNDTVW